ncbi:hypothetical protein Pmani_017727 [Petrolisthes manimaculis]|uniref:Uncharacterized protein n=1 Tax=Petrolisthes manimaculis TaxID=1843537 RepID=A0AAE1PLS5_9EUCA|nr:hypothetical protein Pmani_017727 [Petrolisthes manimaculis]
MLVNPSQLEGNPWSVGSDSSNITNEPQPDPSRMLVNPSQLESNPEYVASEPNEPQPGPNRMLGKKQTGRKPQGNPNKRPMYEENEDEYPNKEDKKRIRASKTSHKARIRNNEVLRKMKEYIKRGLPKP